MPEELWGRDEDLLWYSSGGQFGTITEGDTGIRMLNLKFIWELSAHKLPVLGRYEGTRTRANIAEGLACQAPPAWDCTAIGKILTAEKLLSIISISQKSLRTIFIRSKVMLK